MNNTMSLTRFANLVYIIAYTSLKVRYKNSILGFMWSLLTPLVYLSIFTFVFSNVFPDIENYSLYALTGLIFWNFFSSSSGQLVVSVVEGAPVLKSINIPPEAYPIGVLLSQLMNLVLTFVPFAILLVIFEMKPSWSILLFPFILILFTCFTLGVGAIISAFNVYFRDIGLFWTAITPALFYATPVAFSASFVPEKFAWILQLNPLYHFIAGFREVLYYGKPPTLELWGIMIAIATASLLFGMWVFKKLKPGFVSNY